jgi:hypothetical protein
MQLAFSIIPLRTDIPAYSQEVVIAGTVYVIGVRYNARMARWILDVCDSGGVPIVMGIPLLVTVPIAYRFIDRVPGFPQVQLMVIDETGQERSPERDTLGADIKLVYAEAVA